MFQGMEMLQLRTRGCVFLLSLCYLLILTAAQVTNPSEVNALLAVKNNLLDPMKRLSNWNKGDPCTSNWTGVFCHDATGTVGYLHVRELQLLDLNLSGNLAPELGQLSQLTIMDFMWNELTGSIPREIGNLSSLMLLLLNGNKLSGSLPDELGYLSKLNRLQVDQNNISGPIPKSFAYMSSIRHLHLNNNSISGQIPPELSNLTTLLHLLLDNNNLSGYLPPELSKLPAMRIIQLDNNNFNGSEIPASYGNLSRLAKLDLSKNNLRGSLPSKLYDTMITIDLSGNHLSGSIPGIFSDLRFLQRLSLENNQLNGSVPANIWQNMTSTKSSSFTVDLRNNSLSSILGALNPPDNVTLRLGGNPICDNANIANITQFCGYEAGGDRTTERSTNSTMTCPVQACPVDNFFEYVPASPLPCFCASPLRIGYRLKSPSFSYFDPYVFSFESYVTSALKLNRYQLSIDSYFWEQGPRLRMHLKIFPPANNMHSSTFNVSEVLRIRGIFTSWHFPGDDLFGPYELLNFTLVGPYAGVHFTKGKNISKGVWVAIALGCIACIIAVTAAVSLLIARRYARQHRKMSRRHISSKASMKIDGVKGFTFKEMAMATDSFNCSAQVGRGGYGKVYRGILSGNSIVAIKRAEEGSLQGQKEFLTEIKLLSRLHHINLVSLVGYCEEKEEQMLVYEFMPNGTLRDWLSDKAKGTLNFGTRLRIALGSAKGILYLHTEAQPPVFHRDIKATNILLDSKLTAKVADFGLSRVAPVLDDEGNLPNHVSTVVRGTPGYLDPEYFLTHKLTDKSDVYSLGIVFLELLTGMHPISHGKNIVREVRMAHQSGIMFSIIDNRMGAYPSECVERFVTLALSCCHDKQEKRPSIQGVVRELETILKMMPEADAIYAESTPTYSGKSTPTYSGKSASPSSFNSSQYLYESSSLLGSDLSSGVVPTIKSR
uniref:non-specific serine/threonine protein kinase n=1 Tax=Salix viminalis TaxID=40686 RepID=A0A6N2K7S1_SALVM